MTAILDRQDDQVLLDAARQGYGAALLWVAEQLQGPDPARAFRLRLTTETNPVVRAGLHSALAELTRQGRA